MATVTERLYADVMGTITQADCKNIGVFLAANGRLDPAAAFFEESCTRDQMDPYAACSLGAVLVAQGRLEEAENYLHMALDINSDCAEAWINLSVVHERRGDFGKSLVCLESASVINPPCMDQVLSKLAGNAQYHGNWALAIERYQAALVQNPQYHSARMSLGIMQMLLEEWRLGLENYEARRFVQKVGYPSSDIPVWDGILKDLAGKRVLFVAEQGTGDLFQFARYGATLSRLFGVPASLYCSDAQAELMKLWPGWDHVYSPADKDLLTGPDAPTFDLQFPLMSAMRLLDLNDLPPIVSNRRPMIPNGSVGYTGVIGLCWRGNKGHAHDVHRSMPFDHMKALTAGTGWTYIALQPDITEEERATVPHVANMATWVETARAIANLDVVITVDTAVAHLAGSLGKKVWLMVSAIPDWRWGLKRHWTPWYHSVHIFRQERLGDWAPVIQEIRSYL